MLGILGALIGQFPALLKSGLDYFTTRNSAEIQKIGAGRDVAIATLQAQVAVNQANAALLQSRRFVFLLFLLYMPVLLHAMIIVLGRVHFIVWDVMDFLPWELEILKSLYITAPAVGAVGGFTAWLHK